MLQWSDFSGDNGSPALPLFLSERSQSLALSAVYYLQFAHRWGNPDASEWDEIDGAISECLHELMEFTMPDFTPVGTISAFFGVEASIPAKWLLCDGSSYTDDDYPDLYALMPAGYKGGGNFQVPNLTQRMLFGANDPTADLGALGGENSTVLTIANLPAHSHTIARGNGGGSTLNVVEADNVAPTFATSSTSTVGSGTAHNNIPANINVNFIIKALP